VSLGAILASISVVSAARAQEEDEAIDGEFSVQRFRPAPGPRNFVNTSGARQDGNMAFSAGLMVNYAYKPFVVVSCASEDDCEESSPGREDIPVVENLVTADAMGSFTPIPALQIGLRVPVTYVKGQGLNEEGSADEESGIESTGMGDIELDGKYRFYGDVNDPFVLGGGAFVTGPLGTATAEGAYIGSSTVTGGIRAIVDGRAGPLAYALNLGGLFAESGRVGTTEVGSEFQYAVGASYAVSPVFQVLGEVFGSTRFTANRGENAMEGLLGVRLLPMNGALSVTAGAGTGIIEGVGSPKLRAFLGVMYINETGDKDSDGIKDNAGECPTDPEDVDQHEDGDGCPDRDNDLDSIADSADKCPTEAEDSDEFEDTDGCPEPDNDKDGINDDSDVCAAQPETKNGFKDEDGCPDVPDSDGDGVVDSDDKCPKEPEDTDGFEDTDGCPDLDNDADGVPDNRDECIDEPETKNEFQDDDGCPDEAPDAPKKPGQR
jgi:hypothetical protein